MAWAQVGVSKSKIRLKDGSELNVVIIENVPGKYLKFKLPGNETGTIDYENIDYIKHKDFAYRSAFTLKKGLFFQGATSLLFGRASVDSGPRVGLALAVTANYRLDPHISLGVGVEPTIVSGYFFLPMYAHISGNFSADRVALIYFIDGGWSFAGSNDFDTIEVKGGWLIRPGFGLRINKFTITLGYQLQQFTTTSSPNFWWNTDLVSVEKRLMKNVNFGVRFSF